LIVLTKGLPLAYNRDLQEDKQPIFDSFDTIKSILTVLSPLVSGMELNREVISGQLGKGYLDATTLMEFLIIRGVPQRTAHGIVGKLVRLAMDESVALDELSLQQFQIVYAGFDENVYDYLGAKSAVNSMQSYGSTAPNQVKTQIKIWKDKLEK
jgi:argininosuccinate lyase